jgi:plasmid stability protein
MAREHVAVRAEPGTLERVERIRAAAEERAGLPVNEADVLRAILAAGLAAEERRLGLAAEPTRAPSKATAKKGARPTVRKPSKR